MGCGAPIPWPSMCLLVVVSRLDELAPLVVAANRDERLDRPAVPATVLRHAGPRIVGGRDAEAGGTWLAVNEHGVVAGLTNRPSPEGRDLTRRSRGELPVALAAHTDAASATEDFAARFSPHHYNPAWILVGDRTSLYAIDMTDGPSPAVRALGPGTYILENSPLGAPSSKVDNVRGLLGEVPGTPSTGGEALVARMRAVLADHSIPASGAPLESAQPARSAESDVDGPAEQGRQRPVETTAACVHTDEYGTRSSSVIVVPAGPGRPHVEVAAGHPCTHRFEDVSYLWTASAPDAPRR